MAQVIDYQYIEEISTLDAWRNLASDTTNWYSEEQPWVNTFLINATNQVINYPEWWGGWSWIAWWSTNVSWSASDHNTVAWGSGSIYLPDWTTLSVTSGNTGNMSATTYIYYDQDDSSVHYTTSASSAVWENKILLCVAAPVSSSSKKATFQAFGSGDQSTFISASNIAANTITANEIASNTITASELNVSYLSAISANLWTITAWDITWTTITAWSTSWTAIVLNPNNNRIQIYYGWDVVWYITGAYASWLWSAVGIYGDYVYVPDTFMVGWKLKIPVWTDLYD